MLLRASSLLSSPFESVHATVRILFADATHTVRGRMPAQNLTARMLSSMQPGDLVRDAKVRGLFAQCSDSGAVSLKIQADLRHGTRNGHARKPISVRMTIGRYPALALDAARNEAQRLLAEIKSGRDPRTTSATSGAEWSVQRLRDEYAKDLAIREKSERTVKDLNYHFDHYLKDWLLLPVSAITKDMARERHSELTANHGKYAANHALKAFRTCFNFASEKTDLKLGANPVDGVTFHKERARKDKLTFPPIPGWLKRVRALHNPLRAAMHEIQLFTGLRPGTLVALERAWIRLDERAIVIPAERMKARREFACPLSAHAVGLVRAALAAGDVMFPGSAYLFPSRSSASGAVQATAVWKEKTIPGETGHIVRHLYSNAANAAGVSSVNRQLLLGQTVPGIAGVYLSERALFTTLLSDQEKVAAHLLAIAGS